MRQARERDWWPRQGREQGDQGLATQLRGGGPVQKKQGLGQRFHN